MENSKQTHDITPNMGKFYDRVIPNFGGDQKDSIADLWDNSIDAGSTEIKLRIYTQKGGSICKYAVIDNGEGMDLDMLIESYRFATQTKHEITDQGTFGCGGTVASFTLGDKKITLTKTKEGELLVGDLDIDECEEIELTTRSPTQEEQKLFSDECGDNGTIIIISKLKKQKIIKGGSLKNALVKQFGEIYRKLINKKRNFYIEISNKDDKVVSTKIHPKDPLFSADPEMQKDFYEKEYEIEDGKFIKTRFSYLNLAAIDRDDKSWGKQGICFMRNDRQIVPCSPHKDLWKFDPRANAGRVEISFTAELDVPLSVHTIKNKLIFPQSVVDKIRPDIREFRNRILKDAGKKKVNSTTLKKEEKELEAWEDTLKKHAATICAPKKKGKGFETKRGANKNNTGTVKPKNTGIKRSRPTCSRVVPKFVLTPFGEYSDRHFDINIEDGKQIIHINTDSLVIKKHYLLGSDATKQTFKVQWAAQAMAMYRRYDADDHEYPTIEKYNQDLTEEIASIYSVI